MKKLIKILPIIMTVFMVFTTLAPVFATDIGNVSVAPDTGNAGGFTDIGNNILGIVQVVGTIAAVGILMVVGVKYMMGSAEEKAEYKKVMLPYIIGAVVLFAAANLTSWLAGIAANVTNNLNAQ